MRFCYYGLVKYERALDLQKQAWADTLIDGEARILGFEHPAVVTLGKRSQEDLDVMASNSIPVCNIDRGGHATLHSRGQLVIYPIVKLAQFQMSIREFVECLHLVTQKCLSQAGLQAEIKDSPGLFTENGKIAYIGLRVDRGVTRHGLAVNIRNDLSLFSNIRSCGVDQAEHDSLHKHDIQMAPHEFFLKWVEQISLSGKLEVANFAAQTHNISTSSLGAVGSALP
jgi:lipoyl(octanoyl) transferase